MEEKTQTVDEKSNTTMIGHLLIRDKDTNEVLINQREDLVHQDILGNENAR